MSLVPQIILIATVVLVAVANAYPGPGVPRVYYDGYRPYY